MSEQLIFWGYWGIAFCVWIGVIYFDDDDDDNIFTPLLHILVGSIWPILIVAAVLFLIMAGLILLEKTIRKLRRL